MLLHPSESDMAVPFCTILMIGEISLRGWTGSSGGPVIKVGVFYFPFDLLFRPKQKSPEAKRAPDIA